MNIKDLKTVETKNVKKAVRLTEMVLDSENCRIGQIVGEPGSGKSHLSYYLAKRFNALRVCCFEGISKAQLTRAVLDASGATLPGGTSYDMMGFCHEILPDRLIIVDETNHLNIMLLERIRYFCDELNSAALIIGTPLMSKRLNAQAGAIYAKQLKGRIGSKVLELEPMDLRETAASIIVPAWGDIGKDLSELFHKLTGGWWREGDELVKGVNRILKANGLKEVTRDVLIAAHQQGAAI